MYSVVLMAALSAGVESAPDCHRGGCYGGCYGCYGGGCYGGCYGGGCYGGGCYGGYGYGSGCGCCGGGYSYGCYGGGCYGGGCYGGGYGGGYGGCYGGGYYGAPAAPMAPVAPPETVPPPKDLPKESVLPNKAKLIVEMPADAKLYIDDKQMKTQAEVRTFDTPTLDAGVTYFYVLKAEVVRDGNKVMLEKRVTVKAGEVTRTRFDDKADAVAAK